MGDQLRLRILARVGVVQAVDVGEDDKQVGLAHARDDGGQRIIIAEVFDVLELGGRDRVVLVDDGHDADSWSAR